MSKDSNADGLEKIRNIGDRVKRLRSSILDRFKSDNPASADGGEETENEPMGDQQDNGMRDKINLATEKLRDFGERHEIAEKSRGVLSNPTVQRYLPIAQWLGNYKNEDFSGDLTAAGKAA